MNFMASRACREALRTPAPRASSMSASIAARARIVCTRFAYQAGKLRNRVRRATPFLLALTEEALIEGMD